MHKRFQQVFTSLKERGCVSYAKIATVGGFCDVNLIIVKATAPDDLPLPEKYIHELLKIFSISPSSFHTFSLGFTSRFGKTHCWRVALKCLLLLHRLLRSLPENSPFRSELLWARSNGLLSLYPCHFRDASSSAPEDYTAFIKYYAQLLDEALDCFDLDSKVAYDQEMPESLPDKMKEVGRMIDVLPQIQSLIDRVMDCRPTGFASRSFIVRSAMKHIIRDSFLCYTTFRREIVLVLENLFQMPYKTCTSAFGIYKKAALQANQLCEFYDWCNGMGLCGLHEYPFIDKIPQIQIRALETFLNGMWQLTESSSSTTSPSSLVESRSSLTEDDGDMQVVIRRDIVVSTQWEKFEEDEFSSRFKETDFSRRLEGGDDEEPLIRLEDSENDSWEDLLEASVNLSPVPRSNLLFYPNGFSYGHGYNNNRKDGDGDGDEEEEWKMQVYNPNALNPFYQPYNMPNYYGSSVSNLIYPGDSNAWQIKC